NQEAAFKAQKLADEKTKTELAAVFVPAVAGPAYARPVDAEIPRFAQHVRLSHPSFGGLSEQQLRSDLCPLYLLSAAQLARVESFAGGTLTGWRVQGVPASRADALAPIDRWLVPTHSPKLLFELGGEIYADWVLDPPKRGHGFAVSKIMEIWSFLSQM